MFFVFDDIYTYKEDSIVNVDYDTYLVPKFSQFVQFNYPFKTSIIQIKNLQFFLEIYDFQFKRWVPKGIKFSIQDMSLLKPFPPICIRTKKTRYYKGV